MSKSPALPAAMGNADDADESGAPSRLPAVYPSRSDTPLGAAPAAVRAWFDAPWTARSPRPTARWRPHSDRRTSSPATPGRTTRAAHYRADVRAWCAWCSRHGLTPPGRPADIASFLAAERHPCGGSGRARSRHHRPQQQGAGEGRRFEAK